MARASVVGLVTTAAGPLHDTGPAHPERPARLVAVLEGLARSGLTDELDAAIAPAASLETIARVHEPRYVERVRRAIEARVPYVDTPDVPVSERSFDAALEAAGAAVLAVDRVVTGAWRRAFVAARPPGHHAEESQALGFCLFNSIAIAARVARDVHGIARVAIVDFDVHHGNGTQHLFERDPSVFYASLHQYPHYPGTGAADERGIGDGEGTTLNCPLAAGTGDVEWLRAFEGSVLPALDAFRPDLVLVSAGFDAHALDPLSGTLLSEAAYARMSEGLVEIADRHAKGRLVSLLEGGYSLDGLARSSAAHVAALVAPR